MSRPLRFIPDEYRNWTDSYGRDIAVVEITIRTVLGMFLLKPTPQNRSIIVGVMAHVQQRLKFDIYGYAWLSNHGSYLVGVTGPEHQSAIMREIHSQLARELGRPKYSDWDGAFWGRRGRPILVADEVDQIERLAYCLANSTKEHLVTRPERWPGAHAAKALCGSMTDKGIWKNRTKLDALKRRAGSDKRRRLQERLLGKNWGTLQRLARSSKPGPVSCVIDAISSSWRGCDWSRRPEPHLLKTRSPESALAA